jgi:hypothetical protein
MEVFFVAILFFVIVIVIVLIATLSGNNQPTDPYLQVQGSPARITLDEAKQINRISSLGYVHPQLARALASHLQGDAWQLAHSGLCAALLRQGQQDAALQLLESLDQHHRGVALEQMLEQLIEADNEHQAVQLLAETGSDLPQNSLLRIPLLRAQDRLDEARAELVELEQDKSSLTALQLPRLARQQRALEQKESAAQTLDLAWQLMQASAETENYLGLDHLLRELAELGEFGRLQAIAEQLPAQHRVPAITELIQAGLFEQARALFEDLLSYQQDDLQEQMLAAMLNNGQLVQAGELLQAADDSVHTSLLLQLAQWHIAQGSFSTAAADLQAQARTPHERIDLYLALWKVHALEQPELAASLLDQAERWVAELTEDEQDPSLRLFVLEARLTTQSRLPERQRTSYEIRRGLEEMERLLAQMDYYGRIANSCTLARLLQQLGRNEDALSRVAQARELLRHSGPEDELENFDKALLLEGMAETYLQLHRLDLAQAARSDIPPGEMFGEHQWIEALIEHDHLEQAIHSLSFSTLFSDIQLERLLAKIAELPEQGQARHSQLLAKLRSDELWEPSAAAA